MVIAFISIFIKAQKFHYFDLPVFLPLNLISISILPTNNFVIDILIGFNVFITKFVKRSMFGLLLTTTLTLYCSCSNRAEAEMAKGRRKVEFDSLADFFQGLPFLKTFLCFPWRIF